MKKYFGLFIVLLTAACHSGNTDTMASTSDPIDVSAMDTSVRPQDNFFLYANGSWIKKAVIPASQSSIGLASILYDTTLARLHFLLDSLSQLSNPAKNSPAQQCGDLYFSGMDSVDIDKKTFQPVKWELDSIQALRNIEDLRNEIGKEYAINHGPFFNFNVSPDERNSAINMGHFYQGGLGLPNRDYYFKQDTSIKKIRDAYQALAVKFFMKTGVDSSSAIKKAASIMRFETALAKVSKTDVELRDPIANYHKMDMKTLEKSMPGWSDLLVKMNVHADTLVIAQPEFFKALWPLLAKTPMDELKNYLAFHVLFDDAPYLSGDFVDTHFAYSKLLSGAKELRPRWKRMTELVDAQLGDALGQLYVAKYFPPEAKARMLDLVNNLETTYAERIQGLDWMSDSTKKKAIFKLHAIVKKIGYPDKWKDYSSVNIARDNLVDNIRNTTNYAYRKSLEKIGKPVDRTEWFMTPPTIDAYYDPTQNNINFPAGILQPPFFFMNGDDAVNYGAIGLVIGHEITHGFDDQGRQFDADGNLKDWWTSADAANFKTRASNIINQYNGYVAVDTFHINGALTEGENLADNGGLSIAYAAFKKTAQGKSDSLINGLTPDQRFFLSAAQVWRSKRRDESLRNQVLNDPHSTAMYRVNGPVSNMPSFYEAFKVKPTDPMYRADSVRVKVW